MATNKKSLLPPSKFVSNPARIDIIANRELIESWVELGYSLLAIYKCLQEKNMLSKEYTYKTFVRNYKVIASHENLHTTHDAQVKGDKKREPTTPDHTGPKQVHQDNKKPLNISKQENNTFVIPSNTITGEEI